MSSQQAKPSVQAFGRKVRDSCFFCHIGSNLSLQKTAIAVAHCTLGKGVMKLNGQPIDIMQPECLKMKAIEPVLLLGADRFANLDIRITVKGGGRVAQIYGKTLLLLNDLIAIRQAISRAIVAYYQKCNNESQFVMYRRR